MRNDQIKTVLAEHGFAEGRMISHSKTRYCERNRDHFVVFNAQVFTAHGRILRQVDLDLTLDSDSLTAAARVVGENFFVLYERNPTSSWKPAEKPISGLLREAVFWTRIRLQDQDRFVAFAAGPLWRKHVQLRCTTGHWRNQPAFSVDFWTNLEWESLENYSGAAVQLMGGPPAESRPIEKGALFDAEISTTSDRPVLPMFYQRTGRLGYLWFSHGAAVPALLFDLTIRPIEGLSFRIHRGNSAIHIRREGEVVGLIWPVGISAPEVIRNARARLATERALSRGART